MSNINSINVHRLSSYKHIFNCASDTEALKFYYWNQAVSAELYVLLHNIEVCLRNRIHEVLSFDASNQQSRNYTWFDKLYLKKPDSSSPPVYIDTVLGKSIKKIKRGLSDKGKPHTPQNIICNLEFGKWKYVLSTRTYKNARGRPGQALDWAILFSQIFPQFNNMNRTQTITERLTAITLLRNRVAHLEPVWKFETKTVNGTTVLSPVDEVTALSRLDTEINWAVVFLSWICQDTHDHYVNTNSYRKLRILATKPGLDYFSI